MNPTLPLLLIAIFALLGAWHFYAAVFGSGAGGATVPSRDGKPLFAPSKLSTVAVGIVLFLFAVLIAATSGLLSLGLPPRLLTWLLYALAVGLLVRAVGDFRYIGLFKSVTNSPFARMDTLLYSPLCLLLSAGVAIVAYRSSASNPLTHSLDVFR